jgi:hypothetical protein
MGFVFIDELQQYDEGHRNDNSEGLGMSPKELWFRTSGVPKK